MSPLRPPSPRTTRHAKHWRSVLALTLIVTVTACSSTTQIAVPSAELSKMNVKAHDTRSTVTLVDGRQLEVDALHVGVTQSEGRLLRERSVDSTDQPLGKWQSVGDAPRPIAFGTEEITRVEFRHDKGKGGALGFMFGALGGGLLGAGLGYGIYEATTTKNRDNPVPGEALSAFFGALVGIAVFGLVGLFVGRRGTAYTYDFEPQPGPTTTTGADAP